MILIMSFIQLETMQYFKSYNISQFFLLQSINCLVKNKKLFLLLYIIIKLFSYLKKCNRMFMISFT